MIFDMSSIAYPMRIGWAWASRGPPARTQNRYRDFHRFPEASGSLYSAVGQHDPGSEHDFQGLVQNIRDDPAFFKARSLAGDCRGTHGA